MEIGGTDSQIASRAPLAGYNHNIRYRERIFHVQTEDSGVQRPHILTHMFLEGMIVASLRTDYDDLVHKPDHDAQVRKLMQKQHKQVMKTLRRGELDGRIDELTVALQARPSAAPTPAASMPAAPTPAAPTPAAPTPAAPTPAASTPAAPRPATVEEAAPPPATVEEAAPRPATVEEAAPRPATVEEAVPLAATPTPVGELGKKVVSVPEPDKIVVPVPGDDPGDDLGDDAEQPSASRACTTLVDFPPILDPSLVPLEKEAPPSSRVVNRKEARSVRRGQAISQELKAISTEVQPLGAEQKAPPEVGKRIDLDHPAFSAFPMLEWDESDDEALELDLEAINNLDLDSQPVSSDKLEAIELELGLPPLQRQPRSTSPASDDSEEKRMTGPSSWGEEADLEDPDDFEMMLTPSGPVPLPPPEEGRARPTGEQRDISTRLAPVRSLDEKVGDRGDRRPSLPPIPGALKGPESIKPEQQLQPEKKPPIIKRPSLPVIPLDKLFEVEPTEAGKEKKKGEGAGKEKKKGEGTVKVREDPTVGAKPSTKKKP